MPFLQLGDIISIYYKDSNNIETIKEDDRFVIYNIEYSRSSSGPTMKVYCQEVKND